jgi:uncharacterized cupin superfamily protein
MTTPQITILTGPVNIEQSAPAADRLLSGNPQQTIANYFTDPSNQFFVGKWTSTPGKWRVRYTEHEFCLITYGQALIRGDDGTVHSFGAGDAFVVPAGFSGTWEVVSDCTKIYVIFEKIT